MSQQRPQPAAQDAAPALAAAAAGDGVAAAELTIALARNPCGIETIVSLLNAALNLDEPTFINAVASVAIATELPVAPRVHIAWRLAIAGKGDVAMAVLLSDPAVLTNATSLRQVLVTLRETQSRSPARSLIHQQARVLTARLLPVATPPEIASPYGFPGDPAAAPQARGARVAFHAAPGAPAVTRAEIQAVHADFERVITRVRHPTVAIYPEVFVNRRGQIWTRDGRVFRSYNEPIPAASRAAEAAAPVLPEAVLAVETHNNIFHWFAEWFPTLSWRLDDAGGTMPVLIREDGAPFMAESLRLGAAGPLEIATTGDAVFVERLHVAERGLPMLARPEAVGALMDRLRNRALARHPQAGGGRPVYISRRDAKKRRMTNEAELEAALGQRGYDIVQMTPLPFAEQIARIARAPRIVSAHGAGLVLLAAAAPGRQVVEMMPALRGSMMIRSTMAKISRIVGHNHHVWLQGIPALTDTWSLDLDPFLRLLDSLPPAEAPR